MSATWPSVVRSDYDPDKAVRTGRVQALCDMRLVLMRKPFHLYFAEVTRATATFASVQTFELFIPDYAVGRTFSLTIQAKVTAGTGSWRTKIGSATSASVNVTATTYGDSGPATLTVPTDTVEDTAVTLTIEASAPSGGNTIFLRNLELVAAYFTD